MKSIDIAFYADFGKSYGKGLEIENIALQCKKKEILGKVFIRQKTSMNHDIYGHQEHVLMFGNMFFKLLSGIQKYIFKGFRSRYWQEKVFDYLVSLKIKKEGTNKIFYGVPRLNRSFKKAKSYGYITVLHAAEMNANENLRIVEETYKNDRPPSIWDRELLDSSINCYQYIDFVIAHSEKSKKSYVKNGFTKNNVFLTPMGFDADKIIPKKKYSQSGKTKFLYIGNITKMKGIHLLMEAWENIDNQEAELHMCGDIYEDLASEVKNFTAKNSNVFYHGYVSPSCWFEKCDVFIFPSLSEGFSRVVIEAAASGMTAIISEAATDINLFNNGNNGLIVDSSAEDISEKISSLIGKYDLIEKIGRKASEDFSQFSWEHFGENTSEILLNLHTDFKA